MKRFSLLAAALALLPASVGAQLFNGVPYAQEYQQFLGGSGQNSSYGVQVGPYQGRFVASSLTARTVATPTFSVYCVDYLHYASNSNGLVNVTAVAAGGDFSNTRLNSFADYQSSAYLASLFDSWTVHQAALATQLGGSFSRADVWGGLHAAIWNVATGPDNLGSGRTADARDYFLGLAGQFAGSYDTSGWYVLSEADRALGSIAYDGSGQEFLMRARVPEPSALLLLLTGCLMLFAVSRKRLVDLQA